MFQFIDHGIPFHILSKGYIRGAVEAAAASCSAVFGRNPSRNIHRLGPKYFIFDSDKREETGGKRNCVGVAVYGHVASAHRLAIHAHKV